MRDSWHQISAGQLSADSSSTEKLLFKQKSRARSLIVKYKHNFNPISEQIFFGAIL